MTVKQGCHFFQLENYEMPAKSDNLTLPSNLFQQLLLLVVAGLCVTAIFPLQSAQIKNRIGRHQLSPAQIEKSERTETLSLQILARIPSLGFANLMADWTFLRFLQYFGNDEARQETGYRLSAQYFETIIERDPLFTDINQYLFTSVSLYSGQPKKAIALTDQALAAMSPEFPPQSYYIWRNKAIDEFLLLEDVEKAIQSHLTASSWAEQSGDPEALAVAHMSRQTVEFLKTDPDSRIAKSLAWSNIILRVVDDQARQFAIDKIEEIGGEVTIENGAVRVFLPAEDDGPTPSPSQEGN
ncbi:MAG: hypothetical protein QNJ46_24085 [Leptolyngbyaceae cyanobacterium MO_188.B28]|nr:hypothetical protein [Leptolyngbyaceae cyanobacterium MO_188.B28]